MKIAHTFIGFLLLVWWWYDISWMLYSIEWWYDLIDDCIPLACNSSWWFSNFWVIWFCHLLSRSLLVGPPFKDPSTLSTVGWFWPIWLVCFHEYFVLWCLSCHSPSSYKVSSWYLMFWLGFGGCDSLTTICISPWYFLLKNSWIEMRLGGSHP